MRAYRRAGLGSCFVRNPDQAPVTRPRGRPCRRATSGWVRAFPQVATARAPAPSPLCGLAARRPVPRSPRPRPCTRSRVVAHMSDGQRRARAGKAQSAPPCRRPARRFSPWHRRARVPPAGRTRARLHPGRGHHAVDAPMPRRLARKCLQGRKRRSPCARIGRHGMVAASGKAATTAHDPSATIVHKPTARASVQDSALGRRRARRHALAAFPPAASFPPGPPFLGTPLALACFASSLNKESPGGKDALAARAI